MSRVGQSPIPVPSAVEVTFTGQNLVVKGPRGELTRTLPEGIAIERRDSELHLVRTSDQRDVRALHGLARSLVANMVQGVVEGFEKRLEIHGVGYRAAKQGDVIELSVGFSHTVRKPAPRGIEFEVP